MEIKNEMLPKIDPNELRRNLSMYEVIFEKIGGPEKFTALVKKKKQEAGKKEAFHGIDDDFVEFVLGDLAGQVQEGVFENLKCSIAGIIQELERAESFGIEGERGSKMYDSALSREQLYSKKKKLKNLK